MDLEHAQSAHNAHTRTRTLVMNFIAFTFDYCFPPVFFYSSLWCSETRLSLSLTHLTRWQSKQKNTINSHALSSFRHYKYVFVAHTLTHSLSHSAVYACVWVNGNVFIISHTKQKEEK